MIKHLFKLLFSFSMFLVPLDGFSSATEIESLYQQQLKNEYLKLSAIRQQAQKRETAYIISAVLAVIVFLLFTKYFKLFGAMIALLMIIAGYLTLRQSNTVISEYQKLYRQHIISPVTEMEGFHDSEIVLGQKDIEATHLFAPSIKSFSADALYQSKESAFSYINIVFNTKENAAVERFNQNSFEGFLIMIDKKSLFEGILVSEGLKAKVAADNLVMNAFFAVATKSTSKQGYDIYGEVSNEQFERVIDLHEKDIAISFTKDKIYIALYQKPNPFAVSLQDGFDLQRAKSYAAYVQKIAVIIKQFH